MDLNLLNRREKMKFFKEKLYLLLIVCISLTELQAQEVTPASGGIAFGSGGTVSYSVGQIVYTTNSGGANGSVAQGVQQPFEISVITELVEAKGITLQCLAYPNPTTDLLTLTIEGNVIQSQYNVALYDINGKLLLTKIISENEMTISMKNFAPATYFLKVVQTKHASSQDINKSQEIKTFKIIKN